MQDDDDEEDDDYFFGSPEKETKSLSPDLHWQKTGWIFNFRTRASFFPIYEFFFYLASISQYTLMRKELIITFNIFLNH